MSLKDLKKRIMYVLGGNVLAEDFFVKNMPFFLILIILIIFYTSNRYSCIEKMSEIESLQRELKDAKYESLATSARLIGKSREVEVEALVKSRGVNIGLNTDPVYKVK